VQIISEALLGSNRIGMEKGIYDYAGRSEAEILKKRDRQYLKLLDYLDKIKAFERV
jgi:hypothetical protein